ncbi:hypothetical protein ETAA8_64010 [Anatilimnocola aggregata]|uniref:Prepilin-type N-terminal cleavage/methylation domain-containing protein n=1 Tax=Anatilimnocola aggregata TaxID=2528021 RepID=A0A517YLZ4_9BACT|nr:prepilin-type N-terminal cleavage/methylation domain-containing protein [Anatilimnocola aggregata]QDU31248.1 hypothetical protein ETAA8_64010 [Anatilimnocola aggregata]
MAARHPCHLQPVRGYTLIELLVVIMIAILLMAVTLPAAKSIMENARPREASRILNAAFATAKARAASTGRPCGLEFLLTPVGDPTATPVAQQSTQLFLCEVPAMYSGDTTNARVTVNTSTWELTFQNSCATNLPSLLDSSNVFFIRINYRGPWHVGSYNTMSSKYYITAPSVYPPTSDTGGYAFQILRPPVRIGNPIELPKSTAIDMNYSGFGTGVDKSATMSAKEGIDFSLINKDGGLRIMFSPNGSVHSVAFDSTTSEMDSPNYPDFSPPGTSAPGTIHLLIGLTSKVNLPTASNMANLELSNLADNNALWVSVGRASGLVTSTENLVPTDLSTYSTDLTQAQNYLTYARTYATAREQKGGL